MSDKQKVKFLVDVSVVDHEGKVEFKAKAGQVKELSAASARRWIKRNMAVDPVAESAKAKEAAESAKAKEAAESAKAKDNNTNK